MDLKEIVGPGSSLGADGQGGAANKRPKSEDSSIDENPPVINSTIFQELKNIDSIEKDTKPTSKITRLMHSTSHRKPFEQPNNQPEKAHFPVELHTVQRDTSNMNPATEYKIVGLTEENDKSPEPASPQSEYDLLNGRPIQLSGDGVKKSQMESSQSRNNIKPATRPFDPHKTGHIPKGVSNNIELMNIPVQVSAHQVLPGPTRFQSPQVASQRDSHRSKNSSRQLFNIEGVDLFNKVEQAVLDFVSLCRVREFLLLPEVHKLLQNNQTLSILGRPLAEENLEQKFQTPSQQLNLSQVLKGPADHSTNSNKNFTITKNIIHLNPGAENPAKPNKPRKSFSKKTEKMTLEVEAYKLLTDYLPLSVYLSRELKLYEWHESLTHLLQQNVVEFKDYLGKSLAQEDSFLLYVARRAIKLDEFDIFKLIMSTTPNLVIFIQENFMSEMVLTTGTNDYPQVFFKEFNSRSKKLTVIGNANSTSGGNLAISEFNYRDEDLTRSKVITLCISYFSYIQRNEQILEILSNLGYTKKNLVDLLIDIQDEERLVTILKQNRNLIEFLSLQNLFDHNMYTPLVLIDSMELIKVFNLPVDNKKSSKHLVYHKLCIMVRKGVKVEAICNIINYVNSTFWDMQKLYRFFDALKACIYNKNSNWLIHIQNPLLFCMTLVYFFQKLKDQLDYKDKDILDLLKDMLNFCKIYILDASEEALSINFFDLDSYGKGFLDYALLVGDMSILETEQIEGRIFEMWDLNRHTMQNITDFMQVHRSRSKLEKFSEGFFNYDYSLPIEKGDDFQLEYRYVSNSTHLKVWSEILWPITSIVTEFIFSMYFISLRLKNEFSGNWFNTLYQRHPGYMVVLAYVRLSYTLSSVTKTLAINKRVDSIHFMQVCYNLNIAITFIQLVIAPIHFWDSFWLINLTQTLYVLSVVAYIMMNALSLNEIGVLLRIFFRMALVVVIFGTVSVTYITAIGYTIHVIFIQFSQQALGQIYYDFNLFDDLYQGILTLFEFIFGAVTLYRPYQAWNTYSYALTFVMIMFAFFGNIMLPNILVAFLTSQFEDISQNAKYHTMTLQFSLCKVFGRSPTDTLISMPYPVVPFALPFYLAFLLKEETGRKVNLALRRVIYLLNIFIPTFLILMVRLLTTIPLRYIMQGIRLFIRIPRSLAGTKHFLLWMLKGFFLMWKLFYYDLKTIRFVMLDFSRDGEDLLNYQLKAQTRISLVNVFILYLRTVNHFLHKNVNNISVREFTENLKAMQVQEMILNFIGNLLEDGGSKKNHHQKSAEISKDGDFNEKYCQSSLELAPLLLSKYVSSRSTGQDEPLLDLQFMHDKIKANLSSEDIGKLVAFEKSTLDKAGEAFTTLLDARIEAKLELEQLHKLISFTEERATRAVEGIRKYRASRLN